jgi:hypothetical protein
LELLTDYHSGFDAGCLTEKRDRISLNAFELIAWYGVEGTPAWLGSRRYEAVCWSSLANVLTDLVQHLAAASWWEPAVVIERYVLAAYTAGRSILRRRGNGTIEFLLRPRIRQTLAAQEGQAYQLKTWLRRNENHEWVAEARNLIGEIDQLVEYGRRSETPSEAAKAGQAFAALIDKAHLPQETKKQMLHVIANAMALQLTNLTSAEVDIIELCCASVEKHPDYELNTHGHRLFDTVLLWTVRFLFNRLEVGQQDDPTVAYLFERPDGRLPHEDELKDDFFRWISTLAPGSDLEATNVGGGRADIRLKSSGERLVIEVKRDANDCSFDSIAASYAAQTTDYQNVSIRIGVLLVLDLTTANREGTPHISSLVQSRIIRRPGEEIPRLIIIVKVPGRRKRPSDLTKLAKLRVATERGNG